MGLVEMIKQIRPSLVDLYVNEDVLQVMYEEAYLGTKILASIANKFSMYRVDKTKSNKITMTYEQLENHYYQLLQENVLALRR